MTGTRLTTGMWCVLAASLAPLARAQSDPRFTAALDAAAIRQGTLGSISENSLILGNGDINALLHAGASGFRMRLTKNDVWDARVDTSGDPALATINIPAHTLSGGSNMPPSWQHPYPAPVTCAVLDLTGPAAGATWANIRAQGTLNTWTHADGVATMAIEGAAGASCGWRAPVSTGRVHAAVRVRLSGTANARHYVEVLPVSGGHSGSLWQETPTTLQDYVFTLPEPAAIGGIILYAWTEDGARAENRYTEVVLQGPAGDDPIDLASVSPPPVDTELDLHRAVARVPGAAPDGVVTVRALAQRNVFLIEGDTTVSLGRTPAGWLPAPTTGTQGNARYLVQTLPADPGHPATGDWPGMSFAVAIETRDGRTAVAIVTSMESATPRADAVALVTTTLAEDAGTTRAGHEAQWEQFWSACRVDLADGYLRDVWYRNLYFMRCVSKEGVMPVGLFAGLVEDPPNWHGDYHLNYNLQQTFWGWYGCNHGELSQPCEWLVRSFIGRAQWLANRTYGCGGAFFPHSVFLHEPPDPAACKSHNGRQVAFVPYTYTIGDSGWAVHNLWLRHLHYPDAARLRDEIYPALREVATFYAEFADRCSVNPETGKVRFGPSYSPEHWDWGRDDGTCDIAFARIALKAAIRGAGTLGVDAGLVARWQQTLAKLPAYPRSGGANPVVVDVAGASPTTYNVPVPALPVYPAGEVNWFSPAAERQIFADTIGAMATNGNNSTMILAGARARLGMPDAYSWTRAQFQARQRPNGTLKLAPGGAVFNDNGHFTENFAATAVINELLLQGVNDILRFFPAWPADQEAAFENLRAQGGFLVSAGFAAGTTTAATIRSTAGGRLRFLNPWPAAPVVRVNGTTIAPDAEGEGVFGLDTAAGDEITLTPMATSLRWDADPATPGAQDGPGTWDTGGANWWDGTGNAFWDDQLACSATLGAGCGTAGTVGVSGTILLNRLTFDPAGDGNYTLSGGTLDIGGTAAPVTANAPATILSSVTGTGGMAKLGPAALTLGGVVRPGGGTLVGDGVLAVTGTLGDTALTVSSGGTLAGTGTLTGPVTVHGTLAPGVAGPGVLHATGDLTLGTGATAACQLGGPGGGDLVEVGGNLALEGWLDLEALPGFGPGSHTVFTAGGTIAPGGFALRRGPGPAYSCALELGTPGEVAVTVGLAPYGSWLVARFGTSSGPGTGFGSDPDCDGLANGIEFVLGTEPNPANPGAGSPAGAPAASLAPDGALLITYPRSALALTQPELRIRNQYSPDLLDWADAVDGVDGVAIVVEDNACGEGLDRVTVRLPRALALERRLFGRLVVEVPGEI